MISSCWNIHVFIYVSEQSFVKMYHVDGRIGLIAPKHFKFFWLSNISTFSVPDEGCSKTHRARWIWCGRFLYITIFVVVLSLLVFAFLPTDQLYNIPFVLLIYVFSLSQLFFSCCKCRPWYEHVNNGHLGTIYRKFCQSPTFVSLILLKTIMDMIDLFIL